MQNLKKLLGPLARETQQLPFEEALIPLDCINVLPQGRKTFTDIRELADNIVHEGGIIYPLLVNWYLPHREDKVREHLDLFNYIYERKIKLKDLIVLRNLRFILIAGERRTRAARLIYEKGCSVCIEEFGEEPPGTCYRRHFGNNKIRVYLYQKTPEDALDLQTSENLHINLPLHEEAENLGRRLRAKRKLVDPKYSIARFAREAGKSVSTVREAIHYFTQPESTRDLVSRRIIPYAIGKLLGKFYARVGDTQEGKSAYEYLLTVALGSAFKASDFELIVNNRLFCLENGTPSLDEIIFSDDANKRHVRLVVAQNMVATLTTFEFYFKKANHMLDIGLIGKKDSPYSELSVLRRLKRLVEELKVTNEHLKRSRLKPRKTKEYGEVLDKTDLFTQKLLQRLGEDEL
jgi:hypothetical protein